MIGDNAVDIFDALSDIADKGSTEVKDLLNKAILNVFPNFGTQSPLQVMKELIEYLANAILSAVKNAIDSIFKIVGICIKGIWSLLNTKIEIPLISTVFSTVVDGEDLTVINLVCILGAVPANLIYHATTGENLFLDNERTDALIACSALTEMSNTYSPVGLNPQDYFNNT